ncbi:MAG: LacI family DNA-binding transcriptional regulator, partial [Victivallaceae bacterium]|nr:LacI family DNA-binding transcriptional regulator [Victivallaceae bacterium]
MSVTQQHIAEYLGVSRQLVGFALNDSPRVSEDTRRRIRNAALKLGYQVNYAACALAGNSSRTVALWSLGGYTLFYAKVIRQLDRILRKDGYQLMVNQLNVEAEELELPHFFWPI